MKNKLTIVLGVIFILLIISIVLIGTNIKNKQEFVKPPFDKNVIKGVPEVDNFSTQVLEVKEGYKIYINPKPVLDNNSLIVNFTSLENNNILLKVRILSDEKIIGESGVIKPGEYVKKVKISKRLNKEDEISYVIMGYDKDSYMSEGTIKLSTKVGE